VSNDRMVCIKIVLQITWKESGRSLLRGTASTLTRRNCGSPDSSVGIATGYGLNGRISIPGCVQTGSGAYPASYLMGTGCSFPWSKAVGV
jgi:hypothetical protein